MRTKGALSKHSKMRAAMHALYWMPTKLWFTVPLHQHRALALAHRLKISVRTKLIDNCNCRVLKTEN